ncbi:LLM class flavin-dependent oxidoreductase (plasmid) [Azospirillum melinis]|uniref:LLM class flavin-dependent oxidoreductase n=1 Tax=Azospirillum melinis TaxID=328839 RepID=UPI0037566049
MSPPRQLHLNLNFMNAGSYSSAWRRPESEAADFIDPAFLVRQAQLAERGTFDAVFLADNPALPDRPDLRPYQALEPTIVLAAMAAATTHIGLIATLSTTYNEPYNVARRFASLDHVSGGRSGWNIVTTAETGTARNFGLDEVLPHDQRYARAVEFADVVTALWDSWEPGALVGDKESGRFIDGSRIHPINHRGRFFAVQGALNVPPSPQGRPVIVQAGGSGDGQDLAARHADLVFSVAHSLEEARSFADGLRARLLRAGRTPADVVICPGLVTILGSTEAEAKRRERELWESVPIDYGLARLARTLNVDPGRLKLDEPLPADIPFPENHSQTFFKGTVTLAQRNGLTVRDLVKAQGGGGTQHRLAVGTPEQVADGIEAWFRSGAVDGFNIMPDVTASGLEVFVEEVVPLLRKRGIFREAYSGRTLRDHLGLPPPSVRHRRPAAATA